MTKYNRAPQAHNGTQAEFEESLMSRTDRQSQLDKFKEAARQLETDDDEERFEERLKKLVKKKPDDKPSDEQDEK